MTQQLVDFKKLPNGVLRIEIAGKTVRQRNANRKEILEIVENEHTDATMQFLAVCEYQLCNGWDTVQPEDIGALTSSILLSDYYIVSEHGETMYCGEVYWNRMYQIRSEIDDLLRNGYVDFHCEFTDEQKRMEFLRQCVTTSTTVRSEVVGMEFEERWDENGDEHGYTYWGTGQATPIDRHYCIHCALSMKLWNYTGKQNPITRHTESIYTHLCDKCGQLLEDVEVQNVYAGVEGWQGQPRLAL